MEHSLEKKLKIVRQIKEGYPLRRLCRLLNLDRHMVRNWFLRYEKYGEKGLEPAKGHSFSPEEKSAIVYEHIEKGITLQQISLRYDISFSTIRAWLRKVHSGESLCNKKRGSPLQARMVKLKKKGVQTELEKLQYENLRLRAENALLKKVKALAEEQKAQIRLNGQKPSTN